MLEGISWNKHSGRQKWEEGRTRQRDKQVGRREREEGGTSRPPDRQE